MNIELIYTFNDDREQEILSHNITLSALKKAIKTERSLKDFAIGLFRVDMKEDISDTILKISSCVYLEGAIVKPPTWYKKCNGKIWFEKNRL